MADDTLQPGLEDVLVAETRLSHIDGQAGDLVIAGFPLDELAPNATFEETVFLLWNDRLPNGDELEDFREGLAGRRSLSSATHSVLESAAREERPPMAALRMGVATADLGTGTGEDDAEIARDLVAKVPTMVAAFWRYREGREPLEPDPTLGHAANYLWLLSGDRPREAIVRGLETYLNAVIDHGVNASTFTARVITSTQSDLVSAVTGAVGALKGPLHGGAPGPVLDMLAEIRETGDPETYVRETLDAGDRVMGFGHRVYDVRDPRAAVLGDAAEPVYDDAGERDFYDLATQTETVVRDVLAAEKPEVDLATNVEFYTAVLLHGIGVPKPLFSPTFAVARVAGWTAHCREQRVDNRLIRPRSRYVGERGRRWTPIAER